MRSESLGEWRGVVWRIFTLGKTLGAEVNTAGVHMVDIGFENEFMQNGLISRKRSVANSGVKRLRLQKL